MISIRNRSGTNSSENPLLYLWQYTGYQSEFLPRVFNEITSDYPYSDLFTIKVVQKCQCDQKSDKEARSSTNQIPIQSWLTQEWCKFNSDISKHGWFYPRYGQIKPRYGATWIDSDAIPLSKHLQSNGLKLTSLQAGPGRDHVSPEMIRITAHWTRPYYGVIYSRANKARAKKKHDSS